jgi:putative ABC transport system permease protein
VLGLFLKQGALQTLIALAMGSLLALAANRVFQGLLGPVSVADPLVLLTAALLLGASMMTACWWPARRATRIDPATALRSE